MTDDATFAIMHRDGWNALTFSPNYECSYFVQLLTMKAVAALFSLVGCAAAFAPAQMSRTSSALSSSNGIGTTAPLGENAYFNPMGLTADDTQVQGISFEDLRHKELKHGRMAMLACAGYLTTAAGIRFPGAGDIPDGLASFPALWATDDGKNVIGQMILFVLLAENCNRDFTGKGEFLGDYRNGALDFGWDKQTDEWKTKKRNIELNNGRAAMMGITGLVVHEMMGNSILPTGYLPGQV